MVSVWDTETRLSLATWGASNGDEVGASLAVLKTLDLKGCTVTGDALHCHAAMASAVRERGAHYAFKLKANHGPLFSCAQSAFAAADAAGKLKFFESTDDEHGRHERRRASIITPPADAPVFPDLSAIGRIEAERSVSGGKLSKTVHYVVLSKRLSERRLLEVVRGHWSVENQLHWRLDVVFNEDDARTCKNNGPQNLGVIRRMALDILRAHPDTRSVGRKMKLAAWKKEYFYELFLYL